MTENTPSQQHYQIGAVAKLTGISTHTIRMWERRYGLVEPDRSQSRNRRYNQQDLERLKLIKQLVDQGHTIGTIARLNTPELQTLLNQQRTWSQENTVGSDAAANTANQKVCVVSDYLQQEDIRNIKTAANLEISLLSKQDVLNRRDEEKDKNLELEDSFKDSILFIDQPNLHNEDAGRWLSYVDNSQAAQAVLVYRFSDQATVRSLTRPGMRPVKGPLTRDLLEQELLRIADSLSQRCPIPQQNAAPKFRYEQLIAFSRMTTNIHCECPKHLANLLMDIVNFEQYSKDCQNRHSEDRTLHTYLYELSGSIRTQLEEALIKVAEAEEIPLPAQ